MFLDPKKKSQFKFVPSALPALSTFNMGPVISTVGVYCVELNLDISKMLSRTSNDLL